MSDSSTQVTGLLQRARGGDEAAREELLEHVYGELIAVARARMSAERDDHSLQATDLLHLAMVRLMEGDVIQEADDRRYLFGAAHRAMRQILIDHSRKHRTLTLVDADPAAGSDWNARFEETYGFSVEEFDSTIAQLEKDFPRQAEVINCRFFSGFTLQQTADFMSVSVGTVERDSRLARARLQRELNKLRAETARGCE